MGLLAEFRRRNVIKVAFAYAVTAWLLVEVSATIFPMLLLPEWAGTFVTVLLIIGFPIALIFAWAFELTPEGIKLEKNVSRSESVTHIAGRKLDYLIIAVLATAVGYFAFDKFVLDPSPDGDVSTGLTEQAPEPRSADAADKSIAVLAFADLSPERDQEYFSDGISEELLNVLARIPDLRVAARTSSFRFKGENRDIIDIGKQLNTSYVLEGSVRKADSQVRITAQLIDASDGFHLWSATYDRELDNIFALQDEVSAAVVKAIADQLGLRLEAVPRGVTAANTEAHDAYLRGRHLVTQRTTKAIERAVLEFENAIVLDPGFARAHAELAIAILYLRQWGGLTVEDAVNRATPHIERAMTLDPGLAEAHAASGYALRFQLRGEEALTKFRQAIQINPNYAIVYNAMGITLDYLGHYEEAIAAFQSALLLDPLSIAAIGNNFEVLLRTNRLAEADRTLEKLASISPGRYASSRGARTSLAGRWANEVLGVLDAIRINPDNMWLYDELAHLFATLGLIEEALAVNEAPGPGVLMLLGRAKATVDAAERLVAEDPISLNARHELGLGLAAAGEFARARPILEATWQSSGRRVTRAGLFPADTAVALIAARRDSGNEDAVAELIAAIRDNVRRYREAGIVNSTRFYRWSVEYEEGLVHYLVGEREKGLALIAKSVENGFFIPIDAAYLQELYDDPGYAPIRASQLARQERERRRFLSIVCTDNPYAAVWQPADGTCERFAAAASE